MEGSAIVIDNKVQNPYLLTTKVKPAKLNVNAQNNWLNPVSREIQSTTPLRLSFQIIQTKIYRFIKENSLMIMEWRVQKHSISI